MNIKDYVSFYKEKKLWLFPFNLEEKQRLYWKNLKAKEEYEQACREWDWNNSAGIKLVVGKKGVRVIEVTNKKLLRKTLGLLGLPEDYTWIIYSPLKYGIVVDTPGTSIRTRGQSNKSYKQVLLLWEGYYVLPSVEQPVYFYKNRIPTGHPQQVEDDILLDCVETLINI